MGMIATVKDNPTQNGIELYFNVLPLAPTRELLKTNGFRWNHKKGCWYAKKTPNTMQIAQRTASITMDAYQQLAGQQGELVTPITRKKTASKNKKQNVPATNKTGIRVGAIFGMSWGYDQTNNSYFQVIALSGEKSVRVVEVRPARTLVEAYNAISGQYRYDFTNVSRNTRSVFVKDQVKGDIKRVQFSNGRAYIVMHDHYAYIENATSDVVYESWDR